MTTGLNYEGERVLELSRDVTAYALGIFRARFIPAKMNRADSFDYPTFRRLLKQRESLPEEVAMSVESTAHRDDSFPEAYIAVYKREGIDTSHLE